MGRKMEILYTLIVFSIIISAVNLCNLYLKHKKHKRRKNKYIEIFEKNVKDELEKEMYIQLVIRSNNYINVYFVFKTMGKVSDIFSVAFSVSTLALTSYSDLSGISASISILAVLFVIISIYVNPSKCAKEYLESWRKSDGEILKYIEQISMKNGQEKSIDISKLIINLEESITTDGE